MFLFFPPPFIFTLSLGAFFFFFCFSLAPDNKGYLRVGHFCLPVFTVMDQVPLQTKRVKTWWVKVTHGSTGWSEAPLNLRGASEAVGACPHLTEFSSWKSCSQIDIQQRPNRLKITTSLRFRVTLIKRSCKSRISHSPNKIRQSLSSSMWGKKMV